MITHQKDQQIKELKDITGKYQAKNEEIFYLNKNIEKITNDQEILVIYFSGEKRVKW